MKRFFSMAALALCSTAAFAQYTSVLESNTVQTVTNAWSTNSISVGVNTPSNALYVVDGGIVSSTNVYVGATSSAYDNEVVVNGTGSLDVVDTLQLGPGTNNTVTVTNGGQIAVGNLVITNNNAFNLDDGGTFAVATNFNASMNGFNWNAGGHLSVGGDLTGTSVSNNVVYLDGERDLTIDGGSWSNSFYDLVVGYGDSNSTLTIMNGGSVVNADGYIGWGAGASNNTVIVSGAGTEWRNIGGLLQVGTNNSLTVSDQAWVYVGEAETNDFIAGSAGGIVVASASGANLMVDSGATVSTTGDLVIGGTNGYLFGAVTVASNGMVSAGSLELNSDSTLTVEAGGTLTDLVSMNIQSNSTINGSGTIGFGATDAELGFFGTGTFIDAGIVFSANAANQNTLSFNSSALDATYYNPAQFINFNHLALNDSQLVGSGTLDSFDTIAITGGAIAPGGTGVGSIRLEGALTVNASEYQAQIANSAGDQLSVADALDLKELDLVLAVSGTTPGALTIVQADGGLVDGFASTNILGRPLLYTVDLQYTANEVQVVMNEDTNLHLSSAIDYAATESARTGFNGMKNLVFTRTKQLRRNLVSTTHAIPNEVLLLTSTNAPAGAMGPGDQNTIFDMHVWMQQYTGRGDYDASGFSDGFDMNSYGTTIGADRLVGEALVVGVNYTYAHSTARASNQDELGAESYWVGAYGEWVGVDGLYVDGLLGYSYAYYDSVRHAKDYRGIASYNGQALGAYVDVGQYYYYQENLALSPYMGLHALSVSVDAHNEKETAGSMLHVDQVDRSWVESVLGLKLRHRFDTGIGRFQTTGYAEWTYDFMQDDVYSTMSSGGLSGVETTHVTPDQSSVNAGLGYSWICTDYMEIGVGYNGRFSADYEEHTGSVMLDIMF